MTDIDYVTQVAQLLRQHSWKSVDTMGRVTCTSDDDEHIYTGIDHEQHQAEVLAAAGLLPTHTEWGVLYEFDRDRTIHEPHVTEAAARRAVAASPTDHGLVSRPAHDWKDVTDDQPRGGRDREHATWTRTRLENR